MPQIREQVITNMINDMSQEEMKFTLRLVKSEDLITELLRRTLEGRDLADAIKGLADAVDLK